MEKITTLEPNRVYAVQFVSDKSQKHRGIIMTNAGGKVWRTWNVAERDQWVEKEIHLTQKHRVYQPTEMEIQFAHFTLSDQIQRGRNQKLLEMLKTMKRELNYYHSDKWHRVAERINVTFGKRGYNEGK